MLNAEIKNGDTWMDAFIKELEEFNQWLSARGCSRPPESDRNFIMSYVSNSLTEKFNPVELAAQMGDYKITISIDELIDIIEFSYNLAVKANETK